MNGSHIAIKSAVALGVTLVVCSTATSVTDARGAYPAGLARQAAQTAPDPATCKGILSQAARLPGVLSAVPKYGSSYVLVVPQRLAQKVPNAAAPGLKEVEVGVHGGTDAVDIARTLGVTRVREYPLNLSAPVQPLQDIQAGKLDAAILWAPLAGLGTIELGIGADVSLFTVDRPRAAPPALRASATTDACARAIADELEGSGVLPADLLVGVDFASMIGMKPPAFSLESARAGAPAYKDACSQCHGPDAVADPKGLAPVDLRVSIQRFSYAGFSYIVLSGWPEKSMPPLRGTVTDQQVALIYQYIKARSDRLLAAGSN